VRLTIEILNVLSQCGGYLLPNTALYNQLILSARPVPTRMEFDQEMQRLEQRAYVIGITNELTDERKWKLTESGKVALQEARS
jgi:hypothetical protein